MKVYAGPPAAARQYLEADRGRPDDYYLAEGTGIARRYTVTAERVQEQTPLTGEGYETWVAGRDPATGEPRGRLRTDDRAVRFVEVVVNGPKSWSLAAALHPDVAADVHLHDLRHAGLTLAAQSGATLAEVMRRAGHSSSRAAMIYQHAAERRDAEVAVRLGRLAAGTTPNRTGT